MREANRGLQPHGTGAFFITAVAAEREGGSRDPGSPRLPELLDSRSLLRARHHGGVQ